MNLIDYSIRNPHPVTVVILLAGVLGILSFNSLPRQLTPTVEKPIIEVTTEYLGLSPNEVERYITNRLEEQLSSVEGLKKMTSRSQHGISTVTLEFEWGTDKKIAMIDVNNKLQQVKDLPQQADRPSLKSVSSDNSNPIMWIIFEKPHPDMPNINQNYMFDIGEDIVLPVLRRVIGVGNVWHFGGEEREMRVEFDPYNLARLHLTYDEVIDKLSDENVNTRAGFHEETQREYTVRSMGEFLNPDDILNTVIKRDGEKTITVRDFAVVKDSYKRTDSLVRINGNLSNAFGIIRKAGANVVETCREAEKAVKRLNEELVNRGLPLRLKIVYQDVDYIDEAIRLVKSNLAVGSFLAVLVLLVFLGSFRSLIIISVSIPISLVSVFIILKLMGRTVNIISLAGMAFAVGMVVDNSIVVLENIYRHLAMKKGALKAAYDGTMEVWGAVFASTLTTLAVFVPIAFIQEEAGQLFRDISITISASIALSLLVSITAIPTLASLLLRSKENESFSEGFIHKTLLKPAVTLGHRLAESYYRLMKVLLEKSPAKVAGKICVVAGIGGLLALSFKVLPEQDYLPYGNNNMVFMFIEPVAGARVEQNMRYISDYEKEMVAMDDVENNFLVFSNRFNGGGAMIHRDLATGQRGEVKMAVKSKEMGGRIFTIPGYSFAFAAQRPIFRSADKTFQVEIMGPDILKLKNSALQLIGKIMALPGIHSVRPEFKFGNPELRFIPKRENAARLDVGMPELGEIVESLNAGTYLGEFNDQGDLIDFTFVRKKELPLNLDEYRNLPVWTKKGLTTHLGHLADISVDVGPSVIDHIEKDRAIVLKVQVRKDYPMKTAIANIEKQVLAKERASLAEDYSIRSGGSADDLGSTIRSLANTFLYAVGFIYLLLVALFKSFGRPIVVMLTVVLAVSGSFFGIAGNNWLQQQKILSILNEWNVPNAESMANGWNWITYDILTQLGVIILAGIVVNNAILIVHQTLNNIMDGMEERSALLESCKTRLRPIMMTVISSVFGMIPLAFGEGSGTELYRGLGTALIGGLTFSTIFTLFLVPVLMSLMMDLGFGAKKEDLVKQSLATEKPLKV